LRTELFDYLLPPELIAQTPVPRGESRLMVVHRESQRIEHRSFPDLLEYLRAGDTLVLNDTRVTARRLAAVRDGGEAAEVLLLRPVGERFWEALVKPGKSLKPGRTVTVKSTSLDEQDVRAVVVGTTLDGGRILEFADTKTRDRLAKWGTAPLPPYIRTALSAENEERYQTVYAANGGSAAAPTAGLHFTPELLSGAAEKGVTLAQITLSVGVGTFRPVRTETIEAHEMHGESFSISEDAGRLVNETRSRVIAVGTTSARSLEAAGQIAGQEQSSNRIVPFTGETSIFITPGYSFRVMDALLTNFHLPASTLLMLVSAFAGHELMMEAYREAVRERYRFFSFGDAMLIV